MKFAATISILVFLCQCAHTHDTQSSLSRRLQDLYEELEELEQEKRVLALLDRRKSDTDLEDTIRDWLERYNEELLQSLQEETLAGYNYLTNLTEENAEITIELSVKSNEWNVGILEQGKKFLEREGDIHDADLKRALNRLVYSNKIPPTKDQELAKSLADLETELEGIYGNAEIEKDGKTYGIEPGFTQLMTTSRDWDERLWGWVAWRNLTGPRMRPLYTELVANMNQAARDYDFNDVSESWVSAYEKDPDDFEAMVDKLYDKLRPIYEQLHAYVRRGIMEQYPGHGISETEPIPAHVVDDMWSQRWTTMIDFLMPYPEFPSYDVTPTMKAQNITPLQMFQMAEEFFISIGLEPMTDKFWKYSMIEKPDDRPVQCHGSASNMYTGDDFRIKMCTEVTMQDLQTVHHEMGHVQYYMMYKDQPAMYQEGANNAFHEAVGDTIALSVMTPEHLTVMGLLDLQEGSEEMDPEREIDERDINFLMKMALAKVAFLPFGYLIDKYRWEIFRGNINESNYESKWWEYRTKYQGLKSPVPRTEADFDPGAKYHVPSNTPYIRYFLSYIGQFQFNEALCKAKGHKGPLHRCDIFGSKEAGDLLRSALSLGSSKPWPEVMNILTGQKEFNVNSLINYFKPLLKWLKDGNKGKHVGWTT